MFGRGDDRECSEIAYVDLCSRVRSKLSRVLVSESGVRNETRLALVSCARGQVFILLFEYFKVPDKLQQRARRARRARDALPPRGGGDAREESAPQSYSTQHLRQDTAPLLFIHRRALKWGIIGAVVMRGFMIAVGVAAVQRFRSVTLLFAAILLASSVKLLTEGDHDDCSSQSLGLVF